MCNHRCGSCSHLGGTGTAQERCLPTGDEPGAINICWGCPEAELLQPGHVTSTVMFMGYLLTKSSSLPISLPFPPSTQQCDLIFPPPPRLCKSLPLPTPTSSHHSTSLPHHSLIQLQWFPSFPKTKQKQAPGVLYAHSLFPF